MTFSFSKISEMLHRFSNWIDDKFFPLPATPWQRKQTEQENIEYCANLVWQQINKAVSLKDLYECQDAIHDFRLIWGESSQVKSQCDSMNVEVYLKMKKAPSLQ
jgi:hypothetical protein